MNKSKFIQKLVEETSYKEEKCILINDILEDNFIAFKKNKDKIVNQLVEKLEIDNEEADKIYNISSKIIATGIKNKIRHPFGSKD